jgi:hypothetical protein
MTYQPTSKTKKVAASEGEPIPVVYIPRKPHPNGLEAFILSSFFDHPTEANRKMPYIIDCLPHLQVGDVHSGNVFALFRQR